MERRYFLKQSGAAGVGLLVSGCFDNEQPNKLTQTDEASYSTRTIDLVAQATVIDMLSQIRGPHVEGWMSGAKPFSKADYLKYKTSGVNVFALGSGAQDFDEMVREVESWNRLIASNADYFEKVDSPEKLASINASGKIGVMLTYQDSAHFRTVEDVDYFHGIGQSLSQLTYNPQNRLGCGAFVDNDTGLTEFGAAITQRMNKVGMAVDLSHCGDRTTLDALEVSTKPVLFTHAACRALNPGYARAKTDEALTKMAATGGVVGMPILRFMVRGEEPVNVGHFIDQIDHAVNLLGIEHVGIGSDQNLDTEDALPLRVRKKHDQTCAGQI